jgi:hypothetical protein
LLLTGEIGRWQESKDEREEAHILLRKGDVTAAAFLMLSVHFLKNRQCLHALSSKFQDENAGP